MTDTGPLFVSSGDLIADRRYKWALDQAARGDFAAAAEILAQTVELAPGFRHRLVRARRHPRPARRPRPARSPRSRRRATPIRTDYHGARLQLARLGVRRRHAGHERDLRAAAVRPICRPLRRGADRAARLSRTGVAARSGRGGDDRGRAAAAFRQHARSRLRHRTCRRRVSSAGRLADRRRSVAGDDRASADEGPLRPARHRRYRRLSRRRSRPSRARIRSGRRRRRFCLCERSRAGRSPASRACWRRTACSPSPSKPMRATV